MTPSPRNLQLGWDIKAASTPPERCGSKDLVLAEVFSLNICFYFNPGKWWTKKIHGYFPNGIPTTNSPKRGAFPSRGDGHCSYPLSCPNGYHLKCQNVPCSDANGTLCNVPRRWNVDRAETASLTAKNIQKDVQLAWNILKLNILKLINYLVSKGSRDDKTHLHSTWSEFGENIFTYLHQGLSCCVASWSPKNAVWRCTISWFLWNHFRLVCL